MTSLKTSSPLLEKKMPKARTNPDAETIGSSVITSINQFLKAANGNELITARTLKLELAITEYDSDGVRAIRDSLNVSQAVFAMLMGVSKKLVEAWESGKMKPKGSSSRLLDVIRNNPAGFIPQYFASEKERRVAPRPRSGTRESMGKNAPRNS